MAGSSVSAIWSSIAEYAASAAPYVAAAAAAGSTYEGAKSNKAQIEAQANATDAERARQAEIQKKADSAIKIATAQFTPEEQAQQLAQDQAARMAGANAGVVPTQTDNYQIATPSAPVEVKGDLQRQIGDSLQKAKMSAQAQAVLKAFGDTSLNQNIKINRAGQEVGQLANFSQGSSSLLPLDIAAAHAAGGNAADLASLYGTTSNLASLYSLTRNRKPPAATFGPDNPNGGDIPPSNVYGPN